MLSCVISMLCTGLPLVICVCRSLPAGLGYSSCFWPMFICAIFSCVDWSIRSCCWTHADFACCSSTALCLWPQKLASVIPGCTLLQIVLRMGPCSFCGDGRARRPGHDRICHFLQLFHSEVSLGAGSSEAGMCLVCLFRDRASS